METPQIEVGREVLDLKVAVTLGIPSTHGWFTVVMLAPHVCRGGQSTKCKSDSTKTSHLASDVV